MTLSFKTLCLFGSATLMLSTSCKQALQIDTSYLAETNFLKKNCTGERNVQKVTTLQLGSYVVTRFEPNACAKQKSTKKAKKDSATLALADTPPNSPQAQRLAVLISGDAGSQNGIEPRVASNMNQAANTYENLGYDVLRINNPQNANDVSNAISARYPTGFQGEVETVVHGHGSIDPTTGLHQIAVRQVGEDGRSQSISVPTVDLLSGGIVPGATSQTGMISSCQSGGVCNNVNANPNLLSSYQNIVTSSQPGQLSSDFPTPQPTDPSIEAGLGNYLAFKRDPLLFDRNGDGNVTGNEFQQSAQTPGGTSLIPSALLMPTGPNNFVQVDTNPADPFGQPTGGPNVLTQGPGNLAVENRPTFFPQDMQVLKGDSLLYSGNTSGYEGQGTTSSSLPPNVIPSNSGTSSDLPPNVIPSSSGQTTPQGQGTVLRPTE